jgi:hypothetical protein
MRFCFSALVLAVAACGSATKPPATTATTQANPGTCHGGGVATTPDDTRAAMQVVKPPQALAVIGAAFAKQVTGSRRYPAASSTTPSPGSYVCPECPV